MTRHRNRLTTTVLVLSILLITFVSFDNNWIAILSTTLYLVIHVIEGEIVAPMLLANRFTLNPAGVILALVLWYWMWGGRELFLRYRCWP